MVRTMKYLLARTLLAAILSLWLATPTWAGFDEGLAAYERSDFRTTVTELSPLAMRGHVIAQRIIGKMYEGGWGGLPQDYTEAAKWFLKAAERGDAEAQYEISGMYQIARGVPQVDAEAHRWKLAAAEQGLIIAQRTLGLNYETGMHGAQQSFSDAMKWYLRAAVQGDEMSQTFLGGLYRYGNGVPQNHAEAIKWYLMAAEQGYFSAQYALGELYDEGRGVKNSSQAARWFLAAAKDGFVPAQIRIGEMYTTGTGIPQDFVHAYMWFNIVGGLV